MTLNEQHPSLPPPPPPATALLERFQFTGNAREYFGIWIVNLFLTVVTLGIYSAWAKVRKKRYFYGNTWVGGSNFEYHGNPMAILKGRLIAFVAFVAYTVAQHFSPKLASLALLVMIPLLPLLIVRSLAFNAVNSSYRNLRFRFVGTYRAALSAVAPLILVPLAELALPDIDPVEPPAGVMAWLALLVPVLIFLVIYPYVMGAMKRLHVNGSRFGATPFSCSAKIGQFYGIYIFAFLIFVAIGFVASLVISLLIEAPSLVPILYLGFGALVFAYTQSRIGNLVFNTSRIGEGDAQFRSSLTAGKLAGFYATNLFAITLTLGLAIPWAAIRVQRYRAECLALETPRGLDDFVATAAGEVGATGEAMGELFDVDLSL